MSKWVERALRLLIGGLFVYAGGIKIPEAPEFARAILNFRLVGPDAAVAMAIYLPWLEILSGTGLLFRRLYTGSLAVLTILMLVFIAAVGTAAWRGLDISCGCFGSDVNSEPAWQILGRDFAILCGLAFLVWHERRGSVARGRGIGIEKTRGSV